ncbi:LysR family transcriptional regulator [Rhodophyticola sp. CCM32]|uniref:LysR family transcriptional regulator n=1 Tax=Rhodophyticola sp. CCM32 TaxID=2916397 RepID=UPI00107F0B3E|nr:LysR family transcriptional regulator [Rhodophyticola sp. CCM32]QBY01389.1 LysR family transcriptional regulator [Rhodophyticola sp. CCM32]
MPFEVPNLTLLRQFVVTAEEQGISKAALRLRISQPALSKNIHKLEDILGTKLFVRHASGSELTDAGKLFYERAQVIGLEYQHALQDIRNVLGEQEAAVTIGAGPVWASAILPMVAEKFHTTYPNHRLRVLTGSMDELADDLRLGRIDIFAGALLQSTRLPGFTVRALAQSDMCILASPHHPLLERPGIIDCAAVAGHPFVAFQPSKEIASHLLSVFRSRGAPPPKFAVETGSIFACAELVRSGKYLMFETRLLTASPIGKGLTTLQMDMDMLPFGMGLVHRDGMERVPHLRSLMNIMSESLKSHLGTDSGLTK